MNELRGDLHAQSKISCSKQSLKQIVSEAQDSGFEYVAVADYSNMFSINCAASIEMLQKQIAEIDKLNKQC